MFENIEEYKKRQEDSNDRILSLTSFRPDPIPKMQDWQPTNLTLLDIWNTIAD